MHLDPRPLKPGDLTYQENARLMAHIAELSQGRDLGPKAIADLDEKEERAMRVWQYAEYKTVPDPDRDYEVVCHRSDWYHALYQLAGDDHLFDMQVSIGTCSHSKIWYMACKEPCLSLGTSRILIGHSI